MQKSDTQNTKKSTFSINHGALAASPELRDFVFIAQSTVYQMVRNIQKSRQGIIPVGFVLSGIIVDYTQNIRYLTAESDTDII